VKALSSISTHSRHNHNPCPIRHISYWSLPVVSEDIHEIATSSQYPFVPNTLRNYPPHISTFYPTTYIPPNHLPIFHSDIITRKGVSLRALLCFLFLCFLAARSEVGQGVKLLIYPLCWP
jgi:hypothetical protein